MILLPVINKRRSQIALAFLKRLLPVLLSLLIVIILLTQISAQDALALLDNIDYGWVAGGLFLYYITNILRVFRVRLLLPEQQIRVKQLLAIMIAQSMFNNILPARTGELSFVYFLNKYENVAFEQSTAALILARLFDLVAVAILFIIAATVSVHNLPPYAVQIIWLVLIALLLMTGILLSLVWLGRRSLILVRWLFIRLGLDQYGLLNVGLTKMHQLIEAVEATYTLKRYLMVLIWSLSVWGCTFAWFYTFLRSINIEVSSSALVIGATFAVLSKAIPFISIGGFGAHEAGWTVGFVLVGFDTSSAILSGLVVNILTLISSIIFGVWAILYLNLLPRKVYTKIRSFCRM